MAQNTVLKKPSRVHQAQSRLDRAVARLEQAMGQRSASGAPDDQVRSLRAEVDALRTHNAALERVNGEVAGRLDGVISNLKTALED